VSRARQWIGGFGPVQMGVDLYTYQLGLGVSFQYWPCLFMPSLRFHLGPVKLWIGVALNGEERRALREGR
jgi:hypothetical protein